METRPKSFVSDELSILEAELIEDVYFDSTLTDGFDEKYSAFNIGGNSSSSESLLNDEQKIDALKKTTVASSLNNFLPPWFKPPINLPELDADFVDSCFPDENAIPLNPNKPRNTLIPKIFKNQKPQNPKTFSPKSPSPIKKPLHRKTYLSECCLELKEWLLSKSLDKINLPSKLETIFPKYIYAIQTARNQRTSRSGRPQLEGDTRLSVQKKKDHRGYNKFRRDRFQFIAAVDRAWMLENENATNMSFKNFAHLFPNQLNNKK